jgi:hypothetical protein
MSNAKIKAISMLFLLQQWVWIPTIDVYAFPRANPIKDFTVVIYGFS